MNSPSDIKPIPAGAVTWHFSQAILPAEKTAILELAEQQLETVKKNTRRRVLRLETSAGLIFVKHDHPSSPRDLLKGLWRNKSSQEYAAACAVRDAGVPTASPLAWGKASRDSFFVARGIPDVVDFEEAWEDLRHSPAERDGFLVTLGAFFSALFAANVLHPDMHAGNVVVRRDGGGVQFFLLDLYGASIKPQAGKAQKLALLRWISGWGRDLTRRERDRLLAPLASFVGASSGQEIWKTLLAEKRRQAAARWPGLRRRLLKPGSLVYARITDEGRWLIARGTGADLVQGALHEHFRKVKRGHLLKNDRKRRLSRVRCGGRELIVKEYLKPRWFGRWRYDARAWLGTHQLDLKRIPVARPLAWVKRHHRGWIVFESVGVDNLPNVLFEASPKRSQTLLREAGKLLAEMHNLGISHGDTKTTNFIVCPDAETGRDSLRLVDCDSVRCHTTDRRERFDNELTSFEATIPACTGETARHAFREAYSEHRV